MRYTHWKILKSARQQIAGGNTCSQRPLHSSLQMLWLCSGHLLPTGLPLRSVWRTSAAAEKLAPRSLGTRSWVPSRGVLDDEYWWFCLHRRLCLSGPSPLLHSSAKSPETACHQWEQNAWEGELPMLVSWHQGWTSLPHAPPASGRARTEAELGETLDPAPSLSPWFSPTRTGRWHASKGTGETAEKIL